MKNRLYSIPYNGTNANWYIDNVMQRKENIDHVFLEFPFYDTISHNSFMYGIDKESYESNIIRANHIKNCINFLKKSKGKFRRICTLNAAYYSFKTAEEFKKFIDNIVSVISEYGIDGVILTEYRIARILHQVLPDLEIHTSCNCFSWTVRQMQLWKRNCGVKVFNPPREILRSPSKLKEMADMGFKLKCIVNEGCLFGCPNTVTHAMTLAMNGSLYNSCSQVGLSDVFKGNYILPRWQKYYDDYVYIYKIAGRGTLNDYPFRCLDWYINEEDSISLTEIMIGGVVASFKERIPLEYQNKLTLNMIPDKLMTCECKHCMSCGLCSSLIRKIVPPEYFRKKG